MKQSTTSRKIKSFLLLILTVTLALSLGLTSQAASQKTKALKAYKKMLSKTTIDRNGWPIKSKNCEFAIAYIDNDSIPELILYNDVDVPHMGGYGTLFTYRSGSVKFVAEMDLDGTSGTGYYKKKGIFVTSYVQGGTTIAYSQLKKTTTKTVLSKYKPYAYSGSTKLEYYKVSSGRSKQISKKAFSSNLKKYVKSTKMTRFNFYKNTAKNRKKRLL